MAQQEGVEARTQRHRKLGWFADPVGRRDRRRGPHVHAICGIHSAMCELNWGPYVGTTKSAPGSTQLRHMERPSMSTTRECLIPTVHLIQSCFKLKYPTYNGIIPQSFGLASFGLSRTMTLLMLLTSHSPSSRQRYGSIRGRSNADGYTTAAVPEDPNQHQGPVASISGDIQPRQVRRVHTDTSRPMARRPQLRFMRTSESCYICLILFSTPRKPICVVTAWHEALCDSTTRYADA
jgi:hypothetical protein